MKKYAAGDYVDDEVDLEETAGFGRAAVAEAAKRPTYAQQKAEPKKQSFGQAFAAARKAGDKTFMFNGKKFTTQTKEEAAKKAAPKFDKSKAAEVPKPTMDLSKKPSTPAKRPMKISEIGRRKMSMEDKMKAVRGMAKGGRVRSSCDGIAKRGKTKGKMR